MKYRIQYYIFRITRIIINYLTTLITQLYAKYWSVQLSRNIRFLGIPVFRNLGNIYIGENSRIISSNSNLVGSFIKTSFETGINGEIVIGKNCGLSNCIIVAQNKVIIGDEVYVGGGVCIFDNDFHSTDPLKRLNDPSCIPSKPVEICKRSFIGGQSIILKGVRIGLNSVVGAGSVVTKSIPDNEIWAGNPAKKIGEIEDK